MKKWMKSTAILLSVWLAYSGGTAGVGAASSQAADEEAVLPGDVAKMYRIPHELTFELKGTKGLLDGKPINVDQPILRDGRVYVPVRTLKQSGAADVVEWNAAKREVRVVINKKLMPSFGELRYRIGSNKIYSGDGTAFQQETIPVPFISGGRAYVPIRPLNTYQGIAVALDKGVVTWNWSEKIIEVQQREWSTAEPQTTFTMLYQKDMNMPQFLSSLGPGGWGGSSSGSKIIEKDIKLDGRIYNRISLTAELHPGVNPLLLTAVSAGEEYLAVYRKVNPSEPIPVALTSDAEGYTKLTAPTQGYVKLKAGESLTIAGEVLQSGPLFDEVTLRASKYEPAVHGYEEDFSVKSPIKNNNYSGVLKFEKPGSYWVDLISPKYMRSIDLGPYGNRWAVIIVEVE
ncbi:stalk domain-containing protein [Paenibacillus luteus]|uniref:stalk domain-containing protein n=1 Tax=Paenibacillus luteus TaxID=2545753 RepID=UPI001375F358|nr:stalk domain-containing protein [Paenibacillus luteus]